jgi:LysM repeat protein
MTEPTTPARARKPLRRRALVRVLLVPVLLALVVGASAGGPGPGWIRIKRGDTLSELAVKHHTTVAALRALNHLPGNNLIIAGKWLRIGRVPTVTKSSPKAKVRRVPVRYVVRPGDGVYRIANRFHANPRWIATHNHLPRSWMIHPGQHLLVKYTLVRQSGPPPRVSKAYARSLVRAAARRHGLDPALVLALAYNESGFQQHVTSSVGAVGVMQVMPGTGQWVAKYLLHRPVDLRNVRDNVAAGVAYFAMLRRLTGRNDMALAGYYQGLASVKKRGMFDDTKAYVANILALRRRF